MKELERRATTIENFYFDFTLISQRNIPICQPPAPECELAIVSVNTTDVTVRGDNDGEIEVTVSGLTGGETLTYYLDGEIGIAGTTNLTHTFTGLTSGLYQVYVEDTAGCWAVQNDIVILDGEFRTGDFFKSSPAFLAAVENPVIIGVSTAVIAPQGRNSVTEITITGAINDNDSLTFNLTSPYIYSQKFFAKNFPQKTNYFLASTLSNQVGVPVGTNTTTEIATSLAEALQKDTLIPRVYFINNEDNKVILEAKETGSRFNLNTTNVLSSTGNMVVTQTRQGENFCDGQITDNYSISCEVMVNTNEATQYPQLGDISDYNRVAELILPFNPSNRHRFDIASILKPQLQTPMPDISLTGSTLLPTVMEPFFCKLSELYPLVPNTNTIKKRYKTTTPISWVINSSLSRYEDNNMSPFLGDLATNISADFGFDLSWEVLPPSGDDGRVEFTDYFFDVANTGDTAANNVQFSLWDFPNRTSIIEGWQNSPEFTGLAAGYYIGVVSGETDGVIYTYQRWLFVTPYSFDYDTAKRKNFVNGVKFLTASPNPKLIQRNSNEFLYFVLPRDYGKDLKVKSDLYFYDGTEELDITNFIIATGGTNAGGCMALNLSYDKLGLRDFEVSGTTNRKIKRAEIAVYQSDSVNGDLPYSETKTYRFEIDEMPLKWGVLFQNSLGLFDSFDFIGVVENTISRETDIYTVPLTFSSRGSLVDGFKNTATYNTRITKRVIANTGWIDEAHFDWLKELLKSNNVYSTSTENQNFINLIDYTYKKSSLDDLFEVECVFEWTIYDNNITI